LIPEHNGREKFPGILRSTPDSTFPEFTNLMKFKIEYENAASIYLSLRRAIDLQRDVLM
jgi:hypothetical protein